MQFNSIQYLAFLAVVSVGCFASPARFRWAGLLAASYFFYACWNPAYLGLILLSTGVDYAVAMQLGRTSARRGRIALLLVSLSANLGLLFAFKYFNFFSDALAGLRGGPAVPYHLDVLLPVGISFYTFQTLGYTIDVYRGAVRPERHVGRFALYVAFFPQLVAGPIERAASLLPQLRDVHHWDYGRAVSGLRLILWGLFKKIVVADRLAVLADGVYSDSTPAGGLVVVAATLAFAFQIYCDFSAYSDIAIGSARVLGIRLMVNFNRPYAAASIREFWQRWHISLSTWFRDYCFIPLGGSRAGFWYWQRNIAIVFVLSGLWHGANWTFVCWGALHALYYLVGERVARFRRAGTAPAPSGFGHMGRQAGVFGLVCFAWIFFRAASLGQARDFIAALPLGWGSVESLAGQVHTLASITPLPALGASVAMLGVLLALEEWQEPSEAPAPFQSTHMPVRWSAYILTLVAIFALGAIDEVPFIYFQF